MCPGSYTHSSIQAWLEIQALVFFSQYQCSREVPNQFLIVSNFLYLSYASDTHQGLHYALHHPPGARPSSPLYVLYTLPSQGFLIFKSLCFSPGLVGLKMSLSSSWEELWPGKEISSTQPSSSFWLFWLLFSLSNSPFFPHPIVPSLAPLSLCSGEGLALCFSVDVLALAAPYLESLSFPSTSMKIVPIL